MLMVIWIIDFDKGAIRRPGRWQAKNLARLLLFITKRNGAASTVPLALDDWQKLAGGLSVLIR